jgi:hypothetical protein
MHLTQDYIGKEVRRVVFSLKKASGDYVHVFSILEKIDVDMQDYHDFAPNHGCEFNDYDRTADGKEDKLFFTVDKITITNELFEKPWENYYSGTTLLNACTENYQWPAGEKDWRILPSDDNYKQELPSILPRRTCPRYVRYCVPDKMPDIIKMILDDAKLKKQLKELSEKNLGYDLTLHSNYLGGFIFLTYNTIYRGIHFTEKETKDGVYCRLDYGQGKGQLLSLCFTVMSADGGVVDKKWKELDGSQNLYEIDFGRRFHSLEVDIWDKDNDYVDFYDRLVFVHSIHFDMQVGSTEVHVLDEEGRTIKKVMKYVDGDKTVIGEKNPTKGLIDSSPEYAYQKFEKALDFVFYDGEKDNVEENIERATADILRILDSARDRIYICDVFFDMKSLSRFVLPMKSSSVALKILSGKKELKADDKRKRLMEGIKLLNEKSMANVECRLLIGKKAELHDRFIVADDQVWMLGCSLNEFGNRATTLIRVPKDYKKKLVDRAEEWWNNETLTVDINDAKEDDKAKRRYFICKWLDKLCGR